MLGAEGKAGDVNFECDGEEDLLDSEEASVALEATPLLGLTSE